MKNGNNFQQILLDSKKHVDKIKVISSLVYARLGALPDYKYFISKMDICDPFLQKYMTELLNETIAYRLKAKEFLSIPPKSYNKTVLLQFLYDVMMVCTLSVYDLTESLKSNPMLRIFSSLVYDTRIEILGRIKNKDGTPLFQPLLEENFNLISYITDKVEVGELTIPLANFEHKGTYRQAIYSNLASCATALVSVLPPQSSKREMFALRSIEALRSAQRDREITDTTKPYFIFELIKCRVGQGWFSEVKRLYHLHFLDPKLMVEFKDRFLDLADEILKMGNKEVARFFYEKCAKAHAKTDKVNQINRINAGLENTKVDTESLPSIQKSQTVKPEVTSIQIAPEPSNPPEPKNVSPITVAKEVELPPIKAKQEAVEEVSVQPRVKVKTRKQQVPQASEPMQPIVADSLNDLFPGEAYRGKKMISLVKEGIPEGLYCAYMDVFNPSLCEDKHQYAYFEKTFYKGKIVGRFADGFVFLKNSQNNAVNDFKLKLRTYDLRLHGVLRAVSIDTEGRKHYLFQFGIFKTHKQVDRGEGKQLDIPVDSFDLRQKS